MKIFETRWIKNKSLKNAYVIVGVPGIGNISHICTDYLKTKLDAELVCSVYSKFFPNMVVVDNNSSVDFPCLNIYLKETKKRKIVLVLSNYQPKEIIQSYEFTEELVKFLKKEKVKEIITIAGIGYKDLPKKVVLHCATSNLQLQKSLKKYKELIFDGSKSVALIIGSAGLILGFSKKMGIFAFSILASTWAHPSHIGIKESKIVLRLLSKYLDINIDFSDLNNEIKKINEQIKELSKESPSLTNEQKSNYIG